MPRLDKEVEAITAHTIQNGEQTFPHTSEKVLEISLTELYST